MPSDAPGGTPASLLPAAALNHRERATERPRPQFIWLRHAPLVGNCQPSPCRQLHAVYWYQGHLTHMFALDPSHWYQSYALVVTFRACPLRCLCTVRPACACTLAYAPQTKDDGHVFGHARAAGWGPWLCFVCCCFVHVLRTMFARHILPVLLDFVLCCCLPACHGTGVPARLLFSSQDGVRRPRIYQSDATFLVRWPLSAAHRVPFGAVRCMLVLFRSLYVLPPFLPLPSCLKNRQPHTHGYVHLGAERSRKIFCPFSVPIAPAFGWFGSGKAGGSGSSWQNLSCTACVLTGTYALFV